jgi:hypothetical protein
MKSYEVIQKPQSLDTVQSELQNVTYGTAEKRTHGN